MDAFSLLAVKLVGNNSISLNSNSQFSIFSNLFGHNFKEPNLMFFRTIFNVLV